MSTPDLGAFDGASLSPRALLQKASGLAGIGLLASALALPTAVLLARWFGPRDYGRGQWVILAYGYAVLLRTGAFDGATRAFVHQSRRGDTSEALDSQNLGLSIDTAFSIVPGLLLAAAALAVSDPLRRLGLVLAPVAVLANSFAGYMTGLHLVREQYRKATQILAIRGLSAPLFFIAGALAIGPPAIFVVPIILDLLTIALYAWLGVNLHLKALFDRAKAYRLLRTGFPLGLLAIVYWAYRLVGSTSVAIAGSAATLGIYTFALAPVTIMARVVASLQTVMLPSVWGSIAVDSRTKWRRYGAQLTLLIAVVAAVITNLGQAVFPSLVDLVAPQFHASIPLFEILAGDVFLLSIATVPSLVLDAESIGRQARHLAIWVGGLAVNAAANVAVLSLGWGSRAVAWNDLLVQVLVVAVIFETARASFGPGWRRKPLYSALAGVAGSTIMLAIALHLVGSGASTWPSVVVPLAIRTAIVVVSWAGIVTAGRQCSPVRRLLNPAPEDGVEA